MRGTTFVPLAVAAALGLALAWTPLSAADVYIGVEGTAGSAKRTALGLDAFLPEDAKRPEDTEIGRRLREVVRGDLLFSRYFDLVEEVPPADLPGEEARRRHWRARGALFVLAAKASRVKGQVTLNVVLRDLNSGEPVFSRYYRQEPEYWRALAHRLSDDLVRQLIGRSGIAHSRIAFVNDRTGAKELYVVDYDGAGLRRLTEHASINLLPRWHPDGKRLAFTSYKDGNPDIFMYDLPRGRIKPLSDRQGINLAGGFSPDGTRLAATISREKNPNIFVVDVRSRAAVAHTRHWGVDSSPTFSPDGNSLAFVSDRAGNPQVHTLELATGRTKRLTRMNWCDTPSWSPSGEWIAFAGRAHRKDRMDIFLVDITGTRLVQLTHGEGSNESPSWSPDGRFLVFTTTRNGSRHLYVMDADGSAPHRVAKMAGNSSTPDWGP